MNYRLNFEKNFTLLIAALYIAWAIFFVFNTSFVAIDGKRYYSLFDDAMISMRYAWNFSHGNGLVWNSGEYVEGYSNFLMTLVMSLFTSLLDKRTAVLGVQLLGVFTVLGVAIVAKSLFNRIRENNFLSKGVFVLVLSYYPLSYWSLMGMETGLLSILLLLAVFQSVCWLHTKNESQLFFSFIFFGLAFLTRNDALIYSAITLVYYIILSVYIKDFSSVKSILLSGLILGFFVVSQTVFRWLYYGDILPNTYYLKVDQVPFLIRINDGLVYSWNFIKSNNLLLILALFGSLFRSNSKKIYFLILILFAVAYQIYVGGDAWGRWRFMIPVIPLTMILSTLFVKDVIDFILEKSQKSFTKNIKEPVFLIFFAIICYLTTFPYLNEIRLKVQLSDVIYNQNNINKSVALNAILMPQATIGVFWAGSIPYYTDRYAIDFLGKSDLYIARTYPLLPSEFVWLQKITIPGHNKYDLNYSIKELQPVYIQRYHWIGQNLRRYTVENYVRFEYVDKNGVTTLILKKDSPYVYWDRGKVLMWGE